MAPRAAEREAWAGAHVGIFHHSERDTFTRRHLMESDLILTQFRDGVLTITLNRPQVLNSFNGDMATALQDALRHAATDDATRAVLLAASGRAFCAGQDLAAALPDANGRMPDLGNIVEQSYNPVIRAIRTMEKPVVCAVNGVAAGAGANLAFACDLAYAAESATFIQSFSKIGLIPDGGGTFILPRIVGLQRAAALTMLGDKLTAARAKEWGLIVDVFPDAELREKAMEIATRLAGMPTRGIGIAKRGLNASLGNTLEEQLALEAQLQREAGTTADYAEGVRAFLEKRKPTFVGR
jgi:2-(1,2-epoxy-1,2-dihydrophenyl)acetyl-CoA isomerase